VERGLVGGTTWTFGQNRHCNPACKAQLDKTFLEDLALYCAGQPDPAECQKHAPFTPELYDFVVSFGSSHTAIDDLATRVLWDGTTYGEYTRANKELFASLIGKSFDTLDCHSNGAMACLAALRNGDIKAREVRLFGPQINKEAAQRWLEVARASNIKLVIYIRTGDPVPGLAWGIDTDARANASVVLGRVGQLATGDPEKGSTWGALPGVISAWQESRSGTVSQELANLGLEVHRLPCATAGALDIACHAMTGYEHSREGLDSVPAVPVRR
jgi:hypothetical protein